MDLAKLKTYVEELTQVPPMEWAHFITQLRIQQVKKGEHLFIQDEDCDYVSFILSGVIATYYSNKEGKVAYKHFATDGALVSSYSALLLKEKCFFSAQALTNTWVVTVKFAALEGLYKRHVCWERMARKSVEKSYIDREKREFEYLMFDNLQKYQTFCKSFEKNLDHIPQWMIASYIGISPISLSRLINNNELPEPDENPFT